MPPVPLNLSILLLNIFWASRMMSAMVLTEIYPFVVASDSYHIYYSRPLLMEPFYFRENSA